MRAVRATQASAGRHRPECTGKMRGHALCPRGVYLCYKGGAAIHAIDQQEDANNIARCLRAGAYTHQLRRLH